MNKERIEQAAIEHFGVHPGTLPSSERDRLLSAMEDFRDGAEWALNNLWQEDTDDESLLPPYDKEVIVLGSHPYEKDMRWVGFAHRVNPLITAVQECGKAGWNIPDVKYFLNVELPKNK